MKHRLAEHTGPVVDATDVNHRRGRGDEMSDACANRLCIIDPLLTTYDRKVYVELATHFKIAVLYSPTAVTEGYGKQVVRDWPRSIDLIEVRTARPFGNRFGMFQRGVAAYLVLERPHIAIVCANLRYASFWVVLVLCRLLRIRVYARGHGLFKKRRASLWLRVAYRALLTLADGYICYTPSVKHSLEQAGCSRTKLRVAENSLTNECFVTPQEKTGTERGILFIGRLRKNSHVGSLLTAAAKLVVEGVPLQVHAVGDGEERQTVEEFWGRQSWAHFYGELYEAEAIRTISRQCFVGCYPGNTGLSIVHMMSLSLPPILHDNLAAHQGPEPSYVIDQTNGLLFDYWNAEASLYETIKHAMRSPAALKSLQSGAFATYVALTTPSQAERLAAIIWDDSKRACA